MLTVINLLRQHARPDEAIPSDRLIIGPTPNGGAEADRVLQHIAEQRKELTAPAATEVQERHVPVLQVHERGLEF
jgi:hypothetical protein